MQAPMVVNANPVESIPVVDLGRPGSAAELVRACERLGFFKVVNHGIPTRFISELEAQAVNFFSLHESEKSKAGPPDPFGYGSKRIGSNGDEGRVEYLLLNTNSESRFASFPGVDPESFRGCVKDYVSAVRSMACEILELIADGLEIQQRDAFSRLLKDDESDSVFRMNHYPSFPDDERPDGDRLISFGEHTDPQIISILRSNNSSGLEIALRDGRWIGVPADEEAFFVMVGDSLQVMTNGRFGSVRHRVVADGGKPRLSMIYFGGPPLSEKIAPPPELITGIRISLYKEFTWFEYKRSCYNSRLAENRLVFFENIAAS